MHQLFSNPSAGGAGGLRDITRALRQFCLLHEMGVEQAAIELQSQRLDELITAYRAAHGLESLPDERIRVLLLDEQERAATAAALSEMVAPLLAQRLQADAGPASRPWRARAATGPATPATPRPTGVPAIADMIDGMLSQEAESAPSYRRRTA